jgi:hypothetical protein
MRPGHRAVASQSYLAKVVAESQRRHSVISLPERMRRRMAKTREEGGFFPNQPCSSYSIHFDYLWAASSVSAQLAMTWATWSSCPTYM